MKKITLMFACVFFGAATMFGAGDADASNAILKLLNSRASGSSREYAAAAEEVAEQAKQGKVVYSYVIALISRDKDAPPAARLDPETREEYFKKSRDAIKRFANMRNNPMALYLMSIDYNDTNLLHRAAKAGNIQAQNAWGSILFSQAMTSLVSKEESERMLSEAFDYFKSAAGEGDANGLYNLGMCYWRGHGVKANESTAFNCFRNAAEKGHSEAINNIGAFFREGIVVDKDPSLSAKWFEKSAKLDNPYGQFNYALALRRGEGVTQDFKKAFPLLEKAAEAGCVEAVDVMGVALWKGEGVEADPRRAFALFQRAAKAGYPPAMENISTCYEKGSGVSANEKLALEWKIRARAAMGDRNAQAWLQQNADRK